MLTTDLALRVDPAYEKISRRFLENPDEFALAFAKAWYKLLHRDMGPVSRFLGPWVAEPQLWQDPVPAVDHELVGDADVAALKAKVLDSGLTIAQLVSTAWASAASFRSTDKRGGANGARIRLEPQRSWAVNQPEQLATVLETLEGIQREFNEAGGAQISLADLIVLAGSAAVEKAARDAGVEVTVPFHAGPHRRHAGADRRRLVPGPRAARRRVPQLPASRREDPAGGAARRPGLHARPDRARDDRPRRRPARRSAPTSAAPQHGVLTDRPGVLTNDFFANLLSPGTQWKASESEENVYEIRDLATDEVKWTATAVDLIFGSNSQLRALAEVYASEDAREKFVARLRRRLDQGHGARPVRPRLTTAATDEPGRPARGSAGPRRCSPVWPTRAGAAAGGPAACASSVERQEEHGGHGGGEEQRAQAAQAVAEEEEHAGSSLAVGGTTRTAPPSSEGGAARRVDQWLLRLSRASREASSS